MKRLNQAKEFSVARAKGLGRKLEKDIIEVARLADHGITAAKRVNEFLFGKNYAFSGMPKGFMSSTVENSHKIEKLTQSKIDTFKSSVKSGVDGKGIDSANRLIPGTPGLVTEGNSNKLGKNMLEDMGLKRSTKWSGYQAQHIIPSEMANNPVIQKIGMNFDDSTNGIFLRVPDNDISAMSRHRGYHSIYNEVVERALNRMNINQTVNNVPKSRCNSRTLGKKA